MSMVISHLAIDNYKSLKAVEFAPEMFGVVIGPNGAGKSNFVDCLDFISEIYRHGLELAVARRGGFENVAHRRKRRSKSAVGFSLVVEFDVQARAGLLGGRRQAREQRVRAGHRFSIRASGESLRAPFKVLQETLQLDVRVRESWKTLLVLERDGDTVQVRPNGGHLPGLELDLAPEELRHDVLGPYAAEFLTRGELRPEPTELLAMELRGVIRPLRELQFALGNLRIFQLRPNSSREFGVPTPGAELARAGENLPAVVDLMQRRYLDNWKAVLEGMSLVVPGLEQIEVGYSRSRTLELLFHEQGFGRPWSSAEVSDGTIQTLALMVAIHDPRATMLVIEEPENSVHPWIIRHVVDACIAASATRQILLTTHSPVVMNHVHPEQVWLMWRRAGTSRLARLVERDPAMLKMWAAGEIATFDYIDSGALDEAVPPPADPTVQLVFEGLDARSDDADDKEPRR